MDDDEAKSDEIRAVNEPLLTAFRKHLLGSGLAEKTVDRHVGNIEFFGNNYLLNYEQETLVEGASSVGFFLGDWFIRKAMWADANSIKENITSFKKFYTFLCEAGAISEAVLHDLLGRVKEGKDGWIETANRYNDPEVDFEDVWDFGDEDESTEEESAGPAPDSGLDRPVAAPGAGHHLVLMLSGRSAKALGVKPATLAKIDDLQSVGHWSSGWRCEFIGTHEPTHTSYFLVTNARTLFSFVVSNEDGKFTTFINQFGNVLFHEFAERGIAVPTGLALTFRLVRGQPRSLIGSQNDMLFHTTHHMEEPGASLDGIGKKLNRIPMGALEYNHPAREFESVLAEDPPFETPPPGNIVSFPSLN